MFFFSLWLHLVRFTRRITVYIFFNIFFRFVLSLGKKFLPTSVVPPDVGSYTGWVDLFSLSSHLLSPVEWMFVLFVYCFWHAAYISFPGSLEVEGTGESSEVGIFLNVGSNVCSWVGVLVSVGSSVCKGLRDFPVVGSGDCWGGIFLCYLFLPHRLRWCPFNPPLKQCILPSIFSFSMFLSTTYLSDRFSNTCDGSCNRTSLVNPF